jgi:hypothetical protein
MQTIDLAKDFSPFPGGRFKKNGPFSGEEFRERVLVPALKRATDAHDQVVLTLSDPLAGVPGSFADEAFGGLITKHHFKADEVLRLLKVKATSDRLAAYPVMIENYIRHAEQDAK